MLSVLPFGEAGLARAFPAEIGKSEREPCPKWGLVTHRCSPRVEAGPGNISAEGANPVFFGCGIDLPEMARERHQGLLAKVLGVEVALVNEPRVPGYRGRTQTLVDDLLNDAQRLRPQECV